MKILMLASTFPRNINDYKAKWILELSRKISEKNHDLIVLAPHANNLNLYETYENIKVYRFKYAPQNFELLGYGTFLPHELSDSRVKVIYLYLRNIILMISLIFSMLLSSVKLCKKEKVDILVSHWIFPGGLIGLITAKMLGIFPILKVYGTDLVFMKSFHLNWLGRVIINSYPIVIANSEYTRNIAISFGINDPNKIKVIPEGVELPKIISEAKIESIKLKYNLKNQKIIFSMHRLIPLKGTEYLIKAASYVVNKYPNVKFIIGGEGPLKPELIRLVNELNLSNKVIFLGLVNEDEVPFYYSLCDIYIIPSIIDQKGNTEGLGVPVIEAMSYGKPVIGFDVGGPKYTIIDGVNGFSVKEKDWESMGEKILELLYSEKLSAKFGDEGRKLYYSNYSWNKIINKYEEIFKGIVS